MFLATLKVIEALLNTLLGFFLDGAKKDISKPKTKLKTLFDVYLTYKNLFILVFVFAFLWCVIAAEQTSETQEHTQDVKVIDQLFRANDQLNSNNQQLLITNQNISKSEEYGREKWNSLMQSIDKETREKMLHEMEKNK